MDEVVLEDLKFAVANLPEKTRRQPDVCIRMQPAR